MSGFAVLIAPDSYPQEQEATFMDFLKLTAGYKSLAPSGKTLSGRQCYAAKLDSPATLHKGVAEDAQTGSWLLAAGTVVDTRGKPGPEPDNLLRDYLQDGLSVLDFYDGQFALVIYDGREQSLCVISDPLGYFSIFYGTRGMQTFISTSALAVAQQIQAKPDILAAECFLRTGQVYGKATLWQGVKRALPATILKFVDKHAREIEYWKPIVDEAIARLSFEDALQVATETLSNTIELALRREGKPWIDLTGGFDTRLVATMADKRGIPFTGNCIGPDGHPDVTISGSISREMGWDYVHIALPDDWAEEQRDWLKLALRKGDAHLNVLNLARTLWGHQHKAGTSRVCVQGLGGELWRGAYWRHELFNIGRHRVNYDRLIDFRMFLSPIAISTLSADQTEAVRQQLKQRFTGVLSGYNGLPNTVKLDRLLIFKGTAHGGAYLSAAAGIIRGVIPLYFKAPTTLAFSLNSRWKHPISQRFFRTLLERENPRLATVPTTSGGPALPMRLTNLHKFWPFWQSVVSNVAGKYARQIIKRPTKLFSGHPTHVHYPLPDWRRGWLDYAAEAELLQPDKMRSAHLYNAEELQRFVAQAASETRYDDFLGRIITLEMAMRDVGTRIDAVP